MLHSKLNCEFNVACYTALTVMISMEKEDRNCIVLHDFYLSRFSEHTKWYKLDKIEMSKTLSSSANFRILSTLCV